MLLIILFIFQQSFLQVVLMEKNKKAQFTVISKETVVVGQLVHHYTSSRHTLTQNNITCAILKDCNDYLKSWKALKRDLEVKLMKFCKEIVVH